MQSTYLSRSLFGCTRVSLISAAALVGMILLPVKGTAQQTGNSQHSNSTPESPDMAEHAVMATSLRELVQEAEQKNPQIAASFHGWQASRNVPKQVSALPETQLSVQQFSVGSPRPFAGYSNSDFAYIGFGASQDIPYPGKRQLRARVAEHEANSMEAQTDSARGLFRIPQPTFCNELANKTLTCVQNKPPFVSRTRKWNWRIRIFVLTSTSATRMSTPRASSMITTWRRLASGCPIADARRPN